MYLEPEAIREIKGNLKKGKIAENNLHEFNVAKHANDIDLLITVGGEGTVLWGASHFQNKPVPPTFIIDEVIDLFLEVLIVAFVEK